jgi:integrase
VWAELKGSLPASSFDSITSGVGVAVQPDLHEFEKQFLDHLDRRVKLGELASRSRDLYETAAKRFFLEMARYSVQKMDSVTSGILDDYCVWRQEDIQAKGGSGRGVILETTVLSLIFDYAVQEGVIHKSPLIRRPRPQAPPEKIEPFTEDEMKALEAVEKPALENVVFAVFKYTGLRVSDVASLLWSGFDLGGGYLRWRTAKRGKVVEIPMSQGFRSLMAAWRVPGEPRLFPGMTEAKLYKMVRKWGEQSGVENCHPHRFRHSFACRLLARGATLFDVARLLGDTHQVVDKHYAKWTDGQAERIQTLMEETCDIINYSQTAGEKAA